MVWSHGRSDGYRSFMGYDPQSRVGVIALANAATNVGVDDIGQYVLNRRLQPVRWHKRIAVSAAVMDRYVGQYKFDDGNVLTVVRDGELLVTQRSGQGTNLIFAASEMVFHPEGIEAEIVFDRPVSGHAEALTLHQDGLSWRAVRIR